VELPRPQRVRAVGIAAAHLAQRTKQTLAVSSPSFLRVPRESRASSLGISSRNLERIEIPSAARGPRDLTGFALYELQHFSDFLDRRAVSPIQILRLARLWTLKPLVSLSFRLDSDAPRAFDGARCFIGSGSLRSIFLVDRSSEIR